MGSMGGGEMMFNLLGASRAFSLPSGYAAPSARTGLRRIPVTLSAAATQQGPEPTTTIRGRREPAPSSVPLPRYNGQRRSLRGGRSLN